MTEVFEFEADSQLDAIGGDVRDVLSSIELRAYYYIRDIRRKHLSPSKKGLQDALKTPSGVKPTMDAIRYIIASLLEKGALVYQGETKSLVLKRLYVVGEPPIATTEEMPPPGELVPFNESFLTEKEREIATLVRAALPGDTWTSLAARLSVSRQAVWARAGRMWHHGLLVRAWDPDV